MDVAVVGAGAVLDGAELELAVVTDAEEGTAAGAEAAEAAEAVEGAGETLPSPDSVADGALRVAGLIAAFFLGAGADLGAAAGWPPAC